MKSPQGRPSSASTASSRLLGPAPLILTSVGIGFLLVTASMLVSRTAPAPDSPVASREPTTPEQLAGFTAPTTRTPTTSSGCEYLPVYSHVYVNTGTAADLAFTVSVRNISTETSILIDEVSYFDTRGVLIEAYLDKPVSLAPLETLEYFIETQDQRGGSGANAIIGWRAANPVVRPIVQAVMVRSASGSHAFAFTTNSVGIPSAGVEDEDVAPGRRCSASS